MIALDTSIIIHWLTRDEQAKAARYLELFRQARRGEVRLFLCEAVLAEAVYVLSSPRLCGFSRRAVRQRLLPILGLRGLHTPAGDVHLRALDLYTDGNLDFEDVLLVAHMESEGVTRLYSYDSHLDALAPAVERLKP